jgi:hypothetical protein
MQVETLTDVKESSTVGRIPRGLQPYLLFIYPGNGFPALCIFFPANGRPRVCNVYVPNIYSFATCDGRVKASSAGKKDPEDSPRCA